jgi:cytochrome c oxidase subunit III
MAGHSTEAISGGKAWDGGRSPFSVSYGKMMMWFFLVSDALTFSGLLAAYGFVRHSYTGDWPIGEQVFHAFPFMGDTHLPLIYVAMMTFILIVSSVTMVLAVEAGHRLDKRGVIKWLGWTIVGGFIFVGSQAWEWYHFIHGSAGYVITAEGEQAWLTEDISGKDINTVADFGLVFNRGTEQETTVSGSEAIAIYGNKIQHVQGANMTINEYGPPQYANFFFFITGFHGFHVFSGVVINILIFLNVIRGTYDSRGHFEMIEKTGLYWHFVDLVWVFVFTFFYLI